MSSNDDSIQNDLPPPWEILDLVSHHMDPQTLAIASCVSKSWSRCFSANHLWDPFCTTAFPSLSSLTAAVVPRHRLYALAHAEALHRKRKPRKPCISLHGLVFALSVRLPTGEVNVIMPCSDMRWDPHGLFRFDVRVDEEREWGLEELKEAKVTWVVAEREWKAVFTVAEDSGAGKLASVVDGVFSKELPLPGCCVSTSAVSGGHVADIRVGLKEQDNKRMNKIEKISVGIMSVFNWRHVSVDDALIYLEHFLHG
ncbi:probable F-box protein At5g04010 [Amaranthus tricolor]|uniref:probable F-box protein At5g04010 n=1 Tax=Amaranthus tricolor TaxID=29722 RepID=UPI00258A8467|nr:probable F-box protein At5g04010 [Amaranthus tricolor]